MALNPQHPDAVIVQTAARQHGLVTRYQMRAAGLTARQIAHRVRTGRFVRLQPGVYRISAIPSPDERNAAVLLWAGEEAALSHRSAGWLSSLVRGMSGGAAVEITVPASYRMARAGVLVHRTDTLCPEDVMELRGLRVTAPARTLLDLAGVLDQRSLEYAVARALRDGLTDVQSLERLMARHPYARGIGQLRRLLSGNAQAPFTRSEAEARFVVLVRDAGLPVPECNVTIRGYEVDCLWRTERVVVEIDGFAFHSSRSAFERDRRRDADLEAAGLRVVRFTWADITDRPLRVAAQVGQVLGRSFRG